MNQTRLAPEQKQVHRNRTQCCFVACRYHECGENPQLEAPVKPIVQVQRRGLDSLFSFCKTAAPRRPKPAIL